MIKLKANINALSLITKIFITMSLLVGCDNDYVFEYLPAGWCSDRGGACCFEEKNCGDACKEFKYTCRDNNKCEPSEELITSEWYREESENLRDGCWEDPEDKPYSFIDVKKLIPKYGFEALDSGYNQNIVAGRDLNIDDLILDSNGYPICRSICTNTLTRHLCYGFRAKNSYMFQGLIDFKNDIFDHSKNIDNSSISKNFGLINGLDSCHNTKITVHNNLIKRNSKEKCFIYSHAQNINGDITEFNIYTPENLEGNIDVTTGGLTDTEASKYTDYNRATFMVGKGIEVILNPNRQHAILDHLAGSRVSFEYYHSIAPSSLIINSNRTLEVVYLGAPANTIKEFMDKGCLYVLPPH